MFDSFVYQPLKNLSVSSIEAYLLCPESFRLQRVERVPQLASLKMHAGSTVHAVLEHALRAAAKSGVYPPARELSEMFEPSWKRLKAKTESRHDFIGWEAVPPDDSEEAMIEDFRKMLPMAREHVLPTIRPFMLGDEPMIEHWFTLELDSARGRFPVTGYIDLVHSALADWKTTDGKVSDRARRQWLQFACYSIYVWPLLGLENLPCEKIFLVRGRGGTAPSFERVPFVMTRAHRDYFVKIAAQVWEAIGANVFVPNTETWKCKPEYCQFYQGCQGGISKVRDDP